MAGRLGPKWTAMTAEGSHRLEADTPTIRHSRGQAGSKLRKQPPRHSRESGNPYSYPALVGKGGCDDGLRKAIGSRRIRQQFVIPAKAGIQRLPDVARNGHAQRRTPDRPLPLGMRPGSCFLCPPSPIKQAPARPVGSVWPRPMPRRRRRRDRTAFPYAYSIPTGPGCNTTVRRRRSCEGDGLEARV